MNEYNSYKSFVAYAVKFFITSIVVIIVVGVFLLYKGDRIEQNEELPLACSTRYGKTIEKTFPRFNFYYNDNWEIVMDEVNADGETIALSNERGVEIKYTHLATTEKGLLEKGYPVILYKAEITEAADSQFEPNFPNRELGDFVVGKITEKEKISRYDYKGYVPIEERVAYAVMPKSYLGELDYLRPPYLKDFSFWYENYISLIATSPDGKFTKAEEKDVFEILKSFTAK